MKKFFTPSLLCVIFFLVNSNVLLAQYSTATLNGPWFVYTEPLNPYNDNLNYFVFDGNGNITAMNGFPSPITGTYTVNADGSFNGILNGGGTIPFSGQLTSANEGTGTALGANWKFHRIVTPGALQDKITGTLTTQNYGARNVTINIDNQGNIISATGLTPPVSGKVYADLGVFLGHLTSGDVNSAWTELSIMGYYSSNNLTGQMSMNFNDAGTTNATLTRSNNPLADWSLQTSPVQATAQMGAIKFVSASEGWISIAPGGLLHTTDGGISWTEKILHPTDVISSPSDPALNLSFINASTGWVLKTFGTFNSPQGVVVYKTTDGGTTWERNVLSTTAGDSGFQLQFVNASTGWLLMYNITTFVPTFLKTTDGGANWVPSNGAGIFNFVDANNGWAYSSANQLPPYDIYKTIDGGATWTPIATESTAGQITKMHFIDLNNGWIIGKSGKILKTTNGGVNWTPITNTGITSEYTSKSVYFMNATTGWIGSKLDNSSDNAIVLHTTDGGVSWITQSTPTLNPFGIFFWDANNGWLTSDDNKIARYSSIPTGVEGNKVEKFISIYPNPNNGTFYFNLKDTKSKIKVEIYNLSGQKIYEASNFGLQLKNEIKFTPQSKGIYIIKINDGVSIYTEKIMIQ